MIKKKYLLKIGKGEPESIYNRLSDIATIDNFMLYPDYLIRSRLGFTVTICRATVNDLISNKMDVKSHVVEELSESKGDLKIFLLEGFPGCDKDGNIVLSGGLHTQWNYLHVFNNVLSAIIEEDAILFPSANLSCTINILRQWTTNYFQREVHESLNIRPRKSDKIYNEEKLRDLKNNNRNLQDIFSLVDNKSSLYIPDQEWWLSDIPDKGIGPDRAKEALKYFKSLRRLLMQPVQSLANIPKWGKGISNSFSEFLDKEVY